MEANNLVSSRQPIECIDLEDKATFAVIYEKFDMFREVETNDLNDSVKFAYLEHLLRLSTDPVETENAIRKFKEPLKSKFQTLYDSRLQLLQGVIHGLDVLVVKNDLQGVLAEMVNFNYVWNGSKINVQRTDFGKQGKLGICYTFSFKSKVYILYTPQMTYIDGFDPFSGATKIPILSNNMIKGMSKDFFTNAAVTVEIQTDSNFKRVDTRGSAGLSSPRGSFRSSLKGDLLSRDHNKSPIPKENIQRTVIKKKSSNKLNLDEDAKSQGNENEIIESQENSQDLEDLDEELEDDEESYQSSFEQNLDINKPQERTWEKFQKRALEKQKERDQCGPGDCLSF